MLLQSLPPDKRLGALIVANQHGAMALFTAVNHPESVIAMLELLPENQRLGVLMMANPASAILLLTVALKHPGSIAAILNACLRITDYVLLR